jgi:hypothetical protein
MSQKVRMAIANSNIDTKCPHCQGKGGHTKSQRVACKKKQQGAPASSGR